jgi:hypothetical protein
MRSFLVVICLLFFSFVLLAQGDRGTITGTVSDPAGALVASAAIQAKNVDTGAIYPTESTATGNYTLSQLPAGTYQLTATVSGFKKYVRENILVQVAAVVRIDIALEVGSASESITVSEAVPLLKTESGELSHNVTADRLDSLPVLSIGAAAGSSGIRNPQAVASLLPGTFVQPNSNVRINGAPGNTASYRLEGQDASNGQVPATQAQVQPSVDAIQEVTIQTSNFAAEYGQVGGGFFNYTMRSGSNSLHGSAYDYFVNEVLNANTPWTNTPRPAARRHDYGFTLGGPVVLPKIYNGHDKTFFFFNFEQFRETQNISGQTITVPTPAYRAGNFSAALTGKNLGTDVLGRAILENTIYDPLTQRTLSSGQVVRDPFPNNTIPISQMDPVALKIQALIPQPTRSGLTNNAVFPYLSQRVTDVPAFKIDHSLGTKAKISYFWQQTRTASQYSPTFGASDGLPLPITAAIGTFITARAQRLNFDYTLAPTLLLHLGAGYQNDNFNDDPPVLNYNQVTSLGLTGATVQRLFPAMTFPASQPQGGVKNLGPSSNRHPLLYEKPTANASLTWVRDNHTYKLGGELRLDSNLSTLYTNTNGIYAFNSNETALPYLQTATTGGGNVGFAYASFLLGAPDSVQIAQINNIRLGKKAVGLFIQDTWKITRKLTLDYGLRWDYSSYLKEQYGKLAQFAPSIPNAAAGGRLGAVEFEGDGAGRCNCNFASAYPFAVGPRLGMAYQINQKTVLRAGWGIVYSGTGDANGATQGGLTAPKPFSNPSFGTPALTLANGIPPSSVLPFPNFDPNQYPQAGYATTQAPPVWYDQNAARPARQMQWSVGIQRQISRDFAVEAAYVANRGVWWNAPGLIDVNGLSFATLQANGLDITKTADQNILKAQIGSVAAGRFQNKLPYAGFPLTATVAQSLRPYPQFSTITSLWSPLGKTWYDSLQVKATKRLSHGLSATSTYSWQKQLAEGPASNVTVPGTGNGPVNDVYNRDQNKYLSAYDQPQILNLALNYTAPRLNLNGTGGKVLSWVVRDWTINTYLQYASGLPILAPFAQNSISAILPRQLNTTTAGGETYANRVPGVPLYTQDINCHCYDPNKTFILNPAAWADPAPGTFGTSAAYYSDYRYARHPQENFGFGRDFVVKERYRLSLRAEFTNIFNRANIPNPTSVNALAKQTVNTTTGIGTAGFGWINTQTVAATSPRQGTIVGRFTF